MFLPVEKIESLKWVAIKENLTATEHTSLGDAMNNHPLLILHEATGLWYNGDFPNPAYSVQMYDARGLRTDSIRVGNWILSGLKIVGHFPRVEIKFSITDPLGGSESKVFGNYREGIRSALAALKYASTFSSLAEFKKNDPNEELNELLKDNKKQITLLRLENQELKDQAVVLNARIEDLSNEITRLNIQIKAAKSALADAGKNISGITE